MSFAHRPCITARNSTDFCMSNRKRSLSQYNKATIEKGISSIAEGPTLDSSVLGISQIRKNETEASAYTGTTEKLYKMLDSMELENVQNDCDDENMQKPGELLISCPNRKYSDSTKTPENCEEIEENATIIQKVHVEKMPIEIMRINEVKIAAKKKIKSFSEKKIDNFKRDIPNENFACGFKQGYLEKKSKGLFTEWKTKYANIENNAFSYYENIVTGKISGYIDFKRIPAFLYTEPENKIFMYFFIELIFEKE